MRIKELREQLSKFGVVITDISALGGVLFYQSDVAVGGDYFAFVSNKTIGELRTYPINFEGRIPNELLNIITEFAATPLDQREENKKYLLPLDGSMARLSNLGNYSDRKSFVLFDKMNNRWGGGQLDVDQYELPKFHDADFEFTQAELDFAPEWVKAITPIEIEHD